MRARRKRGIVGGCIAVDVRAKSLSRLLAICCGTDLVNPSCYRARCTRQPRVNRNALRDLVIVGSQTHIGADAFIRICPSIDFVTAIAAILTDQMITLDKLWCGRFWKSFGWLQIYDLMVTF